MKKLQIPSHLILCAYLSGVLTIVLSLLYTALCATALIFRYKCDDDPTTITGSEYFWYTLYKIYIQDDNCDASSKFEQATDAQRVFIMIIVTLCASVICLITAITMIAIIQNKAHRHVNSVVSCYIVVCIAALFVDVVFAFHFGKDYTTFKKDLDESQPGSHTNYLRDIIRQGAFLLMTISLKGFVAHAVNFVLLILLIVYASEFQEMVRKNNHSIHKLGALTAYDQQGKQDENWRQQDIMPFARSSQVNPIFFSNEPRRSPMREQPRPDVSNQAFDRSDSWHHSHPAPSQSAQPFSYLEEIRQSVKRIPSTSSPQPQWRRDHWPPAPPVPAPDYSPPPRRLKSALKPAYM